MYRLFELQECHQSPKDCPHGNEWQITCEGCNGDGQRWVDTGKMVDQRSAGIFVLVEP
jgi:5-methylcytosine-specific restriction endonuclease McrA